MLDRVCGWSDYLEGESRIDDKDLIQRHTRTGRPLRRASFIRHLEAKTGRVLTLKTPGRKSKNSK
jgi:hypothetical protein